MILAELQKRINADIVKIVNIPTTEKHVIEFVTKNDVPKIVSQFETTRNI